METLECPVCATSDERLIRSCLLHGVVPQCAGTALYRRPAPDVAEDIEDGE